MDKEIFEKLKALAKEFDGVSCDNDCEHCELSRNLSSMTEYRIDLCELLGVIDENYNE